MKLSKKHILYLSIVGVILIVLVIYAIMWNVSTKPEETAPYDNIHEHEIVFIDSVNPTCTESGRTHGDYCGVCGEVFISQETH